LKFDLDITNNRTKVSGLSDSASEKETLPEQDQEAKEEEKAGKSQAVAVDESPLAVVGIGASAGGLEALKEFFTHTPADSKMAFVVVSHQDPAQTSLLPEILQRYTEMSVVEVGEDGVEVRQNTVYTKPSDFDIAILRGRLILLKPARSGATETTIDLFFRHLADDQDGKAVGIILSGMGNDGTLGIRALKEYTGMAMAQETSTAKFGSMPQSAIATGLVDYIAPAEDLPLRLMDYVKTRSLLWQEKTLKKEIPVQENTLAKVFALIRSRTSQDFSQYKRSTVMRRIERRMGLHQLTRMDDYVRYLQDNPPEIEILAKEMLIGVTQFFRDPAAWERLKPAISELIQSKPTDGLLRIWTAGCSTGEEAYTMAIVLQESLELLGKVGEIQFQIFATDTDREAIDIARVGRYPANIEVDVSPRRLERFFTKENGTYQISQRMRENVIFASHNIIRDPPFTRLDVLSCRNLLIYLSLELQKKLIPLFHYALNPGGILFLGTAESIVGQKDLFGTLDGKCKIFQKSEVLGHDGPNELPAVFGVPLSAREPQASLQALARRPSITEIAQEQLLERYAPPAVIVTANGDIVYFHGRTGKYLEPSPGKANLNVFAMAREGLRYFILTALRTASKERREVTEEELVGADGGSRPKRVKLTVQPIPKRPMMTELFMVTFVDLPDEIPRQTQASEPGGEVALPEMRNAELERELIDSKALLQHQAEEMQSSQEELTSMNEELQSANEELQSTNEELTTSKEELQSMNEEMLTVNAELHAKIEELTNNQDDMRNLLQSTRIPVLFLDKDLRVRRFTEEAKQLVPLIDNDVGRPITDLKMDLLDESFAGDLHVVLDTLQSREKQVKTTEGKWFQMRILPYRTSENRIDGLVITFSDITAIKKLELSIQDARNYAESIISTVLEPLVVLNEDLRVVSANRSFYRDFHVAPQETEGRLLYSIGKGQWDLPELHSLLGDVLEKNREFEGYKLEQDFPDIGHRIMLLNARRIQSDFQPELILLAIEDVTHRAIDTADGPPGEEQRPGVGGA
jgi:two-component system CheB/CheR fusion protein